MLSLEFCELFNNTYFVEDLRTAGSETPVRGSLFNKVASLTTYTLLSVFERGSSTGVNFVKFLGKLLCRTPPSNHFLHVFSFLQMSEVCSLKQICLVERWWIRRRNSQALSILCGFGNQVETSLSSCDHTCTDLKVSIGSERKGRTEKLVKKEGKFSFHVILDRKTFAYLKNKK